ncbi:prevent-host-death family protein [Rhizobium sp. Root1203]|uniref:hypothetical protein n=1 Tax=Rhizobium sp. Root1203 TaxID=1736427 RepID=UPI00070DB583|nr:hypothetical protein [Rhizobium sp. Root1203]KQV15906.1 prevent-host-death family protein [Rhizobium sp. Root1203]
MRILIDVGEAAERFEEMIELASRGDEILICRNGSPGAALTYITKVEASMDAFLKLAAEGRESVPDGTTSDHGHFYDEHGLPK